MKQEKRTSVLLGLQGGLVGEISPALRGITVGFVSGRKVRIRCYFDGPISDDDRESMDVATIDVDGQFRSGEIVIDHQIVQCDFPRKMESLDCWAFLRKKDVGYIEQKPSKQ